MDPLRLAVVGVGVHGRKHASLFASMPEVALVGVADVDSARASEVAQACSTRPFTDYRALVAEVEAVSIATPAQSHYEISRYFIESGVHVFVEKPIAETSEQAAALVDTIRGRPLVLQIGHVERFNPAIAALKQILTSPRFIEAHRLHPYIPRGTDVGVVMDLMIHDLDIILDLVRSPVERVSGVGVSVLSATEDIANARIEFANGCIANVTASRVSPESMRKIRIFQPDAYISLDYKAQEGFLYRKSDATIVREEIPTERGEPLRLELEAFVRCVREAREPAVPGDQAKQAVDLALMIVRDIEARQR